jgi:hypothetical protein
MRRGVLGAALLLAACAPPLWDVGPLEAREPGLRAVADHRLGDATPYLLPVDDTLVLFLCRWEAREPIPVSLPDEATSLQRDAIELALAAWEGAGLGVRFARGAAPGAGIELRIVEGEASGAGPGRIASSVADCALDPRRIRGEGPLPARMVSARIELSAAGRDRLGRPLALEPAQLVGAVLHELGHALGFQGHVRRGESVMRLQTAQTRRAGRRLLAGERFSDPTLRALYRAPSGSLVGRLRVPAGHTRPVDALLALARAGELAGPVARMGDLEGQILFRDAEGAAYGIWLRQVGAALAGRPQALELVPGPRALQRLSLRSPPAGWRVRAPGSPPPSDPAPAAPRPAGTG